MRPSQSLSGPWKSWPEGKADDVAGQHELLAVGVVDAELGADLRQRRQHHVDRERRQRHQRRHQRRRIRRNAGRAAPRRRGMLRAWGGVSRSGWVRGIIAPVAAEATPRAKCVAAGSAMLLAGHGPQHGSGRDAEEAGACRRRRGWRAWRRHSAAAPAPSGRWTTSRWRSAATSSSRCSAPRAAARPRCCG